MTPRPPASVGTTPSGTDEPESPALSLWIPLPVVLLGAVLAVLALVLVLGAAVAGSLLAAAFFGLIPGLAVIRLLGLRDRPLEFVLGIALSFAIAGLVSVVQAYLGGWSPILTLGTLIAVTLVAAATPPLARFVRRQRGRASAAAGSVGTKGADRGAVAPPPTAAPDTRAAAGNRAGRDRPRAAAEPPPPPVAVIRKRPRAAAGSTTSVGGADSRPSRETRSTIDQLVDHLADQRDGSSS